MVQQPPGQPPGGAQPPPQPPPPPPGQPPQAPTGPPKAQFDASKLPIADIIVAGGALLTWIFCLIAWYKASVDTIYGGGSATGKGGYQWWPFVIYFFLMLFAGFFIANEMFDIVDLNIPLGPIYLIWGIAGTVFILLGFLFKPSLGLWEVSGVSVGMNWPIWIIAIILSAAAIVGGVMKIQEA